MARKATKIARNSEAWDQLSGRAAEDTLDYRDVFETQQLERVRLEKPKSNVSSYVLSFIVGFLVFVLSWTTWSGLHMAGLYAADAMGSMFSTTNKVEFYQRVMVTSVKPNYCILESPAGPVTDQCYEDEVQAQENPPQWYINLLEAEATQNEEDQAIKFESFSDSFFYFELWKFAITLGFSAMMGGIVFGVASRKVKKQNALLDTTDINQHVNDQHIATPLEVLDKFDVFPDIGAHCDVQPSSMISHVMLSNKGLKNVTMVKRYEEDQLDEDGDVEFYKGEVILDDNGEPITYETSFIDENMGVELFDASGVPSGRQGKKIRKVYDATAIKYNPDGAKCEKIGKYNTIADMLNATCELPLFEPQRPAGVYVVDTAPVNTMVIAITRAGKGQTYIEPFIDMCLREKRPNNLLINDPKGELLVKYYVRASKRGYQVVQFNLLNSLKTDIYNPLGMAAEAAREGDAAKCAMYVENIAEVFFPVTDGEDPVWANSANNAFKSVAYVMIDYYLEEERQKRARANALKIPAKVLETELDKMWGHVTLYNCYQLFVQLAAKEIKNPELKVQADLKAGKYGNTNAKDGSFDITLFDHDINEAKKTSFLWEEKESAKMLDILFASTQALPANSIRDLINNAANSLKAMAGAEKMLASVYGIAISAMSFFVDPTISTLTSGTPSQNTDLGGVSFPRRMGVRFDPNYIRNNNLLAVQAVWQAYGDANFIESLGPDFYHEDTVDRTGWARYFFKGKFPEMSAWIKLELRNASTRMLIKTFYFKFTKDFQVSLNGRYFITDPVTEEKVIKNGTLVELVRENNDFVNGHVTFKRDTLVELDSPTPRRVESRSNAIIMNQVRYSEKPKAIFLVTPPHMTKYAKLFLILLKQLVELNFEKSYITKSNQKPLYKTRFIIDELGNLQSEGRGISNFETMLSIGLGQDQQFTLILQTLQQLRDVYGESVDKIVQGNAQPLDARIATAQGWITMGEVKLGDEVLVPSGGSAPISGVYPQGRRPVFRVVRADGAATRACDEHLWDVIVVSQDASPAAAEGVRQVVSTMELAELIKDNEVFLPEITVADDVREHYDDLDLTFLDVFSEDNKIVSVVYQGDELVQCIKVDHPEHLYLTDDFIVTHNTSNIIFLKSTDDTMIDTLVKMSGTRHTTYRDSKTVTMDNERMVKSTSVKADVSYTMGTVEEPVISYNDLAFISERNSIVFRAGDAPVWNRNETILPMSWKMFGDRGQNSIVHPGHEYTMQTIPTLSTAKDFDVRLNQPDFNKMVLKRVEQASMVNDAKEKYARGYNYTDFDVQMLDPDIYANDIMDLIDVELREIAIQQGANPDIIDSSIDEVYDPPVEAFDIYEDYETQDIIDQAQEDHSDLELARYANKQISRLELIGTDNRARHGLDDVFISAFIALRRNFANDPSFMIDGSGALRLRGSNEVLIWKEDDSDSKASLRDAMAGDQRVFADDADVIDSIVSWHVDDAFYMYLASLEDWSDIAGGEFERRVAVQLRNGL